MTTTFLTVPKVINSVTCRNGDAFMKTFVKKKKTFLVFLVLIINVLKSIRN